MSSQEKLRGLIANVEKVIIGKRESIMHMVVALLSGGHVIIEDVPGVGKTSMVASMARSLSLSFRRIQFTPDVTPSDLTGFMIYHPGRNEFEFREGVVMCNILLADEINRTSPKTQSSLLEVMEERQVTIDGVTRPLPVPFFVMATQNPIEYVGTYPLPEAQLDRFFMKIVMGYPDAAEERAILSHHAVRSPLHGLEPVMSGEDLLAMQKEAAELHVDDTLLGYAVELARRTREHPMVALGVSPRGTLCLLRAARAAAYCRGASFVLPDDIQAMAVPVWSHRLVLKREARMENVSPGDLIKSVLKEVKVPV